MQWPLVLILAVAAAVASADDNDVCAQARSEQQRRLSSKHKKDGAHHQGGSRPPTDVDLEGHELVFIAGAHGSGTSLMDQMLGKQDGFSRLQGTGKPEDEGQWVQVRCNAVCAAVAPRP